MANDLSAYIPKILAMGLVALRKQAFLPMLVNRQYEREAGLKGSTITIPIAADLTVADVSPAATPPSTSDVTPTTTTIALDQWKEVAFYLTDKDFQEIDEGMIPDQIERAMQALADYINTKILAEYSNFYGYAGTAGTNPFATSEAAALSALQVLNEQNAPYANRFAVIDPAANAKALALRLFQDASWRADGGKGLTEGMLGRTLGADWYMHQAVPQHTLVAAGTILLDDSAARAVGLKVLHMDGATTKPGAGDIFTIAGDTQTYVVVSSTTLVGTDTDVTFEPGLKAAIPAADGNEVVTFKATHRANLVLHRDAIAFATRPLDDGMANQLGTIIKAITDPLSKVTFRLEVRREHKRTRFSFDVLYGIKTVRRELGARLAG